MKSKQRSSVRIIAGNKKGSRIPFPDIRGLRPSGDRVREMLFAWLQTSISGCDVLDMFAGSGALGFESASRGARRVVMLEKNITAVDALKKNCERLDFSQVAIHAADATDDRTYTNALVSDNRFYLILIDPPFDAQLTQSSVDLVQRLQLLRGEGFVYVESDKRHNSLHLPDNWELHREKVAGEVKVCLYRVIAAG